MVQLEALLGVEGDLAFLADERGSLRAHLAPSLLLLPIDSSAGDNPVILSVFADTLLALTTKVELHSGSNPGNSTCSSRSSSSSSSSSSNSSRCFTWQFRGQ